MAVREAVEGSVVTQVTAGAGQEGNHDVQLAYSGSDTEQAQWVRFGELPSALQCLHQVCMGVITEREGHKRLMYELIQQLQSEQLDLADEGVCKGIVSMALSLRRATIRVVEAAAAWRAAHKRKTQAAPRKGHDTIIESEAKYTAGLEALARLKTTSAPEAADAARTTGADLLAHRFAMLRNQVQATNALEEAIVSEYKPLHFKGLPYMELMMHDCDFLGGSLPLARLLRIPVPKLLFNPFLGPDNMEVSVKHPLLTPQQRQLVCADRMEAFWHHMPALCDGVDDDPRQCAVRTEVALLLQYCFSVQKEQHVWPSGLPFTASDAGRESQTVAHGEGDQAALGSFPGYFPSGPFSPAQVQYLRLHNRVGLVIDTLRLQAAWAELGGESSDLRRFMHLGGDLAWTPRLQADQARLSAATLLDAAGANRAQHGPVAVAGRQQEREAAAVRKAIADSRRGLTNFKHLGVAAAARGLGERTIAGPSVDPVVIADTLLVGSAARITLQGDAVGMARWNTILPKGGLRAMGDDSKTPNLAFSQGRLDQHQLVQDSIAHQASLAFNRHAELVPREQLEQPGQLGHQAGGARRRGKKGTMRVAEQQRRQQGKAAATHKHSLREHLSVAEGGIPDGSASVFHDSISDFMAHAHERSMAMTASASMLDSATEEASPSPGSVDSYGSFELSALAPGGTEVQEMAAAAASRAEHLDGRRPRGSQRHDTIPLSRAASSPGQLGGLGDDWGIGLLKERSMTIPAFGGVPDLDSSSSTQHSPQPARQPLTVADTPRSLEEWSEPDKETGAALPPHRPRQRRVADEEAVRWTTANPHILHGLAMRPTLSTASLDGDDALLAAAARPTPVGGLPSLLPSQPGASVGHAPRQELLASLEHASLEELRCVSFVPGYDYHGLGPDHVGAFMNPKHIARSTRMTRAAHKELRKTRPWHQRPRKATRKGGSGGGSMLHTARCLLQPSTGSGEAVSHRETAQLANLLERRAAASHALAAQGSIDGVDISQWRPAVDEDMVRTAIKATVGSREEVDLSGVELESLQDREPGAHLEPEVRDVMRKLLGEAALQAEDEEALGEQLAQLRDAAAAKKFVKARASERATSSEVLATFNESAARVLSGLRQRIAAQEAGGLSATIVAPQQSQEQLLPEAPPQQGSSTSPSYQRSYLETRDLLNPSGSGAVALGPAAHSRGLRSLANRMEQRYGGRGERKARNRETPAGMDDMLGRELPAKGSQREAARQCATFDANGLQDVFAFPSHLSPLKCTIRAAVADATDPFAKPTVPPIAPDVQRAVFGEGKMAALRATQQEQWAAAGELATPRTRQAAGRVAQQVARQQRNQISALAGDGHTTVEVPTGPVPAVGLGSLILSPEQPLTSAAGAMNPALNTIGGKASSSVDGLRGSLRARFARAQRHAQALDLRASTQGFGTGMTDSLAWQKATLLNKGNIKDEFTVAITARLAQRGLGPGISSAHGVALADARAALAAAAGLEGEAYGRGSASAAFAVDSTREWQEGTAPVTLASSQQHSPTRLPRRAPQLAAAAAADLTQAQVSTLVHSMVSRAAVLVGEM